MVTVQASRLRLLKQKSRLTVKNLYTSMSRTYIQVCRAMDTVRLSVPDLKAQVLSSLQPPSSHPYL